MGVLYYVTYRPRSDTLSSIYPKQNAYAIAATIHQDYHKNAKDRDNLPCFPKFLMAQAKAYLKGDFTWDQKLTLPDLTFSALTTCLSRSWKHPYGDSRQCHFETVWIFNFDNDTVLFSKLDKSGHLPLSVLRRRRVTFDDFISCEIPSPPVLEVQIDFAPPYWEPALQVQERTKAFTRRVLDDFNFQWQHILRGRYNDLTFRKLAYAVVRIMAIDFNTVELTMSRQGLGGALVGILDLPEWVPLAGQIVKVGRIWVSASQDPADHIPLIREHLATRQDKSSNPDETEYLILSVRHIVVFRVHGDKLEWTRPVLFLNGTSSVSDRALDLLIWATSTDPPRTSIHTLPVEIQDRILRHLSQGPVEAAKIGCTVGLSSAILWRDGKMVIQSERVHRGRTPASPVESQIWFDDHMRGISYKEDLRTLESTHFIT